jgi:hypothetical protein
MGVSNEKRCKMFGGVYSFSGIISLYIIYMPEGNPNRFSIVSTVAVVASVVVIASVAVPLVVLFKMFKTAPLSERMN